MIARLWHGRVPAEFEPAVVHYEVVGGGPSVDPGTGS